MVKPEKGKKYAPSGFEFDPVLIRDFIRSHTEKLYVIYENSDGTMAMITEEEFSEAPLNEVP